MLKISLGIKVLFSLAIGASAIAKLTGQPQVTDTIARLGYPEYLASILAFAYLHGIVGIWQTKVPFLRSWAYAGFIIALHGAVASHVMAGDSITQALPAVALMLMAMGLFFATEDPLNKAETPA